MCDALRGKTKETVSSSSTSSSSDDSPKKQWKGGHEVHFHEQQAVRQQLKAAKLAVKKESKEAKHALKQFKKELKWSKKAAKHQQIWTADEAMDAAPSAPVDARSALAEMGFTNVDLNEELLTANNGNLKAVIGALLSSEP